MARTLHTLIDGSDSITDGSDNIVGQLEWGGITESGGLSPLILWDEHMRFHTLRLDSDEESFGDPETLPRRVEDELKRLMPAGFLVHVSWSDADDEDYFPFLTFEVTPEQDLPLDMLEEDAWSLLWPAIATLLNVTDPGTYGSEYLFTKVIVRR